jgi:hypothetical protein
LNEEKLAMTKKRYTKFSRSTIITEVDQNKENVQLEKKDTLTEISTMEAQVSLSISQ